MSSEGDMYDAPQGHEYISHEAFSQRDSTFKDLMKFLDARFVSKKGDPENTMYIPAGKSYKLQGGSLEKAMNLMTMCYKNSVIMHFAEIQQTMSGIMIDLDIDTKVNEVQVDEDTIKTICEIVYTTIMEVVEAPMESYEDYIAVLKAKTVREKTNRNHIYYRESVHILVPGCHIKRDAKHALMKKLKEADIESLFEFELYGENSIIDCASAYVPVFFLGSCKIADSKTPDPLYKMYKVTYNGSRPKKTRLRVISDDVIAGLNLCWELSINNNGNFIKSREFATRAEFANVEQERVDEGYSHHGELSSLMVTDVNAKLIYSLVGLFNKSRSDNYLDWNRINYCLACRGPSYKPIAEKFSARSEKHTPEEFEAKWASCCTKASIESISEALIYSIARKDNPDAYAEVIKRNAYGNLVSAMFAPGRVGKLGQYRVAELLSNMLVDKFKCFIPKGGKSIMWIEFMVPGDNYETGQVYKYRMIDYPGNMDVYISTSFMALVSAFYNDMEKESRNVNGVHSEDKVKFYKYMVSSVGKTMEQLESNIFKRSVIQQAAHLPQFYKPQLANMIDNVPYCIGVGNGVLHLGKSGVKELPCLIDYYHSHPITKFTPIRFEWYNPNCPITRKLEDEILSSLFPEEEQDAYEFIMILHAMCLDGYPKPPYLMILQGEGSNGKSCLRMLMQTALHQFVKTQGSGMLTQELDTSKNVCAAAADLMGRRAVFIEEFNEGDRLISASLKLLLGGTISAAAKFKDVVQFDMTSMMFALMNPLLRVDDTDAGTWRRLLYYKMKMLYKFKNDPKDPYDSNNPFHRIRDDTIFDHFIRQPEVGTAFLSILVKWYVIFKVKYNGEINKVPRPSIDKETLEYRNGQDYLNNWLFTHLARTPSNSRVLVGDVASAYVSWCNDNLNVGKLSSTRRLEVEKQINANTMLIKLNCIESTPIGNQIVGYRVMEDGEELREGEKLIKSIISDRPNANREFESANFTDMTIQEWFAQNHQ